MPKYDYKCTVCNHMFEISQSFSSEPISDCPECSSLAKRQFQVVPIVFKGSGFYVNDYGKKGSTSTSSNSDNSNNETSETKKPNKDNQNDNSGKSNTKAKKEKPISDSKQNITTNSTNKEIN
ncbi:MAG: FmdB family transcriptional regulator [Chloroflexi bacterium]|nr:FmdB family transcriptional regulator [Chloroflexota bacterium]MCH2304221.1 hypothetical protein [SAR202 cluster bacterium]